MTKTQNVSVKPLHLCSVLVYYEYSLFARTRTHVCDIENCFKDRALDHGWSPGNRKLVLVLAKSHEG